MSEPDPWCPSTGRHGTRAAYSLDRCRCTAARRDEMRYRKQLRMSGPRLRPALATHRRLRALMANGWSLRALGAELGVTKDAVKLTLHVTRVTAATEQKVAALAERLWNTPGPSARTRAFAARQGWLPLAWWDEDRIGDPDYDPRKDVLAGPAPAKEARAERLERVAVLHGQGYSAAEIAVRLQMPQRQVERDRADLGLVQHRAAS